MNEPDTRRARVVSVGRNAAWVVPLAGAEPQLASFRKTLARTVLAPGDVVRIRALEDDRVIVEGVETRSFALVRTTPGGRTKTMAANVETLAIVAALVDPPPSLAMIDRLIAFAVQHGVDAALVLTKADLAGPEPAAALAAIYEPLGVTTLVEQHLPGVGRRGGGRRPLALRPRPPDHDLGPPLPDRRRVPHR
jgi:ribosome biogenesis GTPase / thiamine phosphate phosphatase